MEQRSSLPSALLIMFRLTLEGMEQDIQTCCDLHFLGASCGVHHIDNTECWLQRSRCDTGLEGPRGDIEDGSSGSLRSGSL
jgi:hypothetical protein